MRIFVWAVLPIALLGWGQGDRPIAPGLPDASVQTATAEEDAGAAQDASGAEPEPLGGAECVTADDAAYVASEC